MKKALALAIAALAFVGCARFGTTQTDISKENTDGTTTRTITTKASSYTVFSSDSSLTKWKAAQTDTSQGAEVGLLEQHTEATNVNEIVRIVIESAVKAAVSLK